MELFSKHSRLGLALGLGIVMLLTLSESALAGLGENENSVEADRQALMAVRNASVAHSAYTVHEVTNGGVTVREYAANGVVFGVAWNGVSQPELSSLLGSYNSEFQSASQRSVKARLRTSSGVVQGAHVVVERSGHMRAMKGRAYVLALLPQGVSADEIQ